MQSFVAFLAVVAALLSPVSQAAAVDPGSQLVGCDQADTAVTLNASAHLDPSCTYTQGIEIVASDVVLDCQGAHIVDPGGGRYGVYIHAPHAVALANITVRNCYVEGFLNNFHVEHEGFRDYTVDDEYDNAFSNIVIEDSTSLNSHGVGIFVDGYVTGVTLSKLHVEGAGSTGIYLEHGSKDNVVENSTIVNNGFSENGPSGQFFTFAGVTFWFWGSGREGLAIDGSRFNTVKDNTFSGNSAGAIFLYKNCGEFVHQKPDRWWTRRYGANGNLIEGNVFTGGDTGVWIGSRMGENTLPMDCSDPPYLTDGLNRIVLDHATDNVVHANTFQDVTYAIRVEDDRSTITDNVITGSASYDVAILVGTRFRTPVLGLPVDGSVISGNRATIAGSKNPYRWVHGQTNTTFTDNQSLGRPVGFCEGVEPRRNALIFVLAFVPADPNNPPTGGPPVFPPPDPLPPCPTSCASGAAITDATLALRRLGTPPGDDALRFDGEMLLPFPYSPVLDLVTTGVALQVNDASGAHVVDLTVPGGAYAAAARVGWKTLPSGGWRYVDRRPAPPGGITSVVVKVLSRRAPGLLRFTVKGARGSYVADPAELPLSGVLVLDPPTAETGQCGQASFAGPATSCRGDGRSVVCR
jgi:parallel beta-helix repeat protein